MRTGRRERRAHLHRAASARTAALFRDQVFGDLRLVEVVLVGQRRKRRLRCAADVGVPIWESQTDPNALARGVRGRRSDLLLVLLDILVEIVGLPAASGALGRPRRPSRQLVFSAAPAAATTSPATAAPAARLAALAGLARSRLYRCLLEPPRRRRSASPRRDRRG